MKLCRLCCLGYHYLATDLGSRLLGIAKDGAYDLSSVNPGIYILYMCILETYTVAHQVVPLPSYIFQQFKQYRRTPA